VVTPVCKFRLASEYSDGGDASRRHGTDRNGLRGRLNITVRMLYRPLWKHAICRRSGDTVRIKEHSLGFKIVLGLTGEGLSEVPLDALKENIIDISDCRGRS
jgi:hypothetical protein